MCVKLVLGFAVAVGPATAGTHHRRCGAKYCFQLSACLLRMLIELDTKRQAAGDVARPRPVLIAEHRNRRTKHDRLRMLSGAARVVLCRVNQKPQPALQVDATDTGGLGVVVLEKRAE